MVSVISKYYGGRMEIESSDDIILVDELIQISDRHLQIFGFTQEEYLEKYSEIKKKINIDEILKVVG